MSSGDDQRNALLRLTLTPGLGPTRIRRAIETLGSPADVLTASMKQLESVNGIGADTARTIHVGLRASAAPADEELALAERLGVRLVAFFDEEYPELLRELPGAPPLLYVRGLVAPQLDRYCVAIVGSRSATHYGTEQAERFAYALAQAGITIVSGGARGVDTAAHRATLRAQGRTIVVLGCGLAECYPPENHDLYEKVVEHGGTIVSELPLRTPPQRENFPNRNRIVSGMSLGVLVIEAPKGSGALITARLAVEEQGREAMAIPGRVDSPASEGSNELIRAGAAALVASPRDVIEALEAPARYVHDGAHPDRYADPARESDAPPPSLFELKITDSQRALLDALTEPSTFDELVRRTGLAPERIRADATLLEVRGVVTRRGSKLARRG